MTSTLKFAALIVVIVVIAVVSAFHSSSHKMFPATAGLRLLRAPREPSKELFPSRCFSTVKNVWFQLCKVPDPFNLQDTGTLVGAPYFVKCDIDETIVSELKEKVKEKIPEILKAVSVPEVSIAYRRFKSDIGSSSNTSQLKIAEEFLELAKLFADGCEGSYQNPLLVCIPQETHPRAQQLPDDHIAVNTWRNVQKGYLTSDNNATYLRFPSTFRSFKDNEDINSIFVRNGRKEMYDTIWKQIELPSMPVRNFVVTGVPGIGKSVFAYYFIWRVLHDKSRRYVNGKERRFFFQHSPSEIYMFDGDNVFEIEGKSMHTLSDKDSILISDMKEKKEPVSHRGITIILSSPNPDRYKETIKSDGEKLVMNPWSYQEIMTHWWNMYRQTMSKDEVEHNFGIVGGVPRLVFQRRKKCEAIIATAIGGRGQDIRRLLSSIGGSNANDNDVTYKLLHIFADTPDSEPRITFASSYAMQELLKALDSTERDATINFINRNSGNDFQSAVGWKFEAFVHNYVSLHGLKHSQLHRLASKSKNVEIMGKWSTANLQVDINDTIDFEVKVPSEFTSINSETNLFKQGVYYKPKSRTMQSSDAFCIHKNNVLVFQATVAERHPVKTKGLLALIDVIKSQYPGHRFHWHLVFLTRESDNANNFKKQPFIWNSIENGKMEERKEITPEDIPWTEELASLATNQWIVKLKLMDSVEEKVNQYNKQQDRE